MKSSPKTVHTCEASLKLLADFWNLRIIEALSNGSLRYCEIQRAVGNVNPATLTKKLLVLENEGLLVRAEDEAKGAVFYALTVHGKDALPVLKAVQTFALKTKK